MEFLLKPKRPAIRRPLAAWLIQTSLWLFLYGGLLLLIGIPELALGTGLAFLFLLVIISNAKYASLREPFTYRDFRYLTDAIRHPRLYLPFLGSSKAILIGVCGLALLLLAVSADPIVHIKPELNSRITGLVILLIGIAQLVILHKWWHPTLSFDASIDMQQNGFWASLWLYKRALQNLPCVTSPFQEYSAGKILPDMIAVQSESFFDPRVLFSGIRSDILATFDQLTAKANFSGPFMVPAWGANTVRTEFAFLTGLDEKNLGAHRFNPYESIARGWSPKSIPSYLKELGYRTVCIHPYDPTFYRRHQVFPRLGFDELIGIDAFKPFERQGAYIGDLALADKITEVISAHKLVMPEQPIYVFAITMENHGPLHLEKLGAHEKHMFYTQPLPAGCDTLSIYLRHLQNADEMMVRLKKFLLQHKTPASLCWYGDHVPIMPSVYKILGHEPEHTNYFIWQNYEQKNKNIQSTVPLEAFQLAPLWLNAALGKLES
jgi:hypothetical protein